MSFRGTQDKHTKRMKWKSLARGEDNPWCCCRLYDDSLKKKKDKETLKHARNKKKELFSHKSREKQKIYIYTCICVYIQDILSAAFCIVTVMLHQKTTKPVRESEERKKMTKAKQMKTEVSWCVAKVHHS